MCYTLITGGAGYIGSHTNALLNALGVQTIVLDNLGLGHKEALEFKEICPQLCGGPGRCRRRPDRRLRLAPASGAGGLPAVAAVDRICSDGTGVPGGGAR